MDIIKVLVVDPHALFRVGLVSLLRQQTDFEVVGEALDSAGAIQLAKDLRPDIVLMDVRTAGFGGAETAQQIKEELPFVKIVLLTTTETEDELLQAIRTGVHGYLPKQITSEGLYRSIRGVFHGEVAVSRSFCSRLFKALAYPDIPSTNPHHEAPSPREWEVLELVATGASNKEIAALLSISDNTVKTHLRNVMGKLHLDNRVQLAAYALRFQRTFETTV